MAFTHSGGTSTGDISAVTDQSNGTYTATFTGQTAGTTTTIGTTIDGNPVTSGSPTVTVTVGAPSLSLSTVDVSAPTVAAGEDLTLTLTARDPGGNLLSGLTDVAFDHTGGESTGEISAATDQNDGTYTATFTGQTAGTATTIGATIDGNAVTSGSPTVTVTVGAPSLSLSTVDVSAPTVAAGEDLTLTLTARDPGGNLLSGLTDVAFDHTGGESTGEISAATDQNDGTYTATFTGQIAGTATTLQATIGGDRVDSTVEVTVQPGDVNTATSIVTVDDADGVLTIGETTTVTLRAKDSFANDLPTGGLPVAFTLAGGTSNGTFSTVVDVGDGTYTAILTGTIVGTPVTVGATIAGNPVTSAPLPIIRVNNDDCGATGMGRCWYIAPDGDDGNAGTIAQPLRTPQNAVVQAQPGDVIYLRGGTYDQSHGTSVGTELFIAHISGNRAGVASGTADNLITFRNYPNERAEITQIDGVRINGVAFWRIEGLTINGGHIGINERFSSNTHDIYVIGNEVFNYAFRSNGANLQSNPGVIKVDANRPGFPDLEPAYNIFIVDNIIHDFIPNGVQWDDPAPPPGFAEHNAAITILACGNPVGSNCLTRRIEVRNNTVYNVPSFSYVKLAMPGPVIFEGNTIHDVRELGRWAAEDIFFERNLVYDVLGGVGARLRSANNTVTIRSNTFVDNNMILRMAGSLSGHTIEDNVFFGFAATGGRSENPSYIKVDRRATEIVLGGSSVNQIDNNCFITPDPDFFAHTSQAGGTVFSYTLAEMRSILGLEVASPLIVESDKTNVFSNPANQDFRLIGAAAAQCTGKGAF